MVVPHSHWDREWYATFEQFRFHLVRFMDDLISLLEEDEEFHSFLLDGQVILLEDYLQIRPENEARLRCLIREGRIDIGPWYIQPDEALVSGEALVRNLLIGDRKAREFGPVMKQGYVPDTFGHIDQLPQILAGFDINTFYFMRGLGQDLADIHSEFWWEAPDGSRVLAHNLSESYSNAAILADDPESVSIHHGDNVSYDSLFELRDRLADRTESRTILLLNGSDHMAVQKDFSHYVSSLDAAMGAATGDRVYNGKLEDFEREILAHTRDSGSEPKSFRGELRFGRYHNVLKNVLSTRVYLKQENEAAQQLLEGTVERFSSVAFVAGARDQSAFLGHAWRDLLRNQAHDSICGCSIDEVHREMSARSLRITQVAEKVLDEALGHLAGRVAPRSEGGEIPVVVFNPSPWTRSGSARVGVLPYRAPPYGERTFEWSGAKEISPDDYHLLDPEGNEVPFEISGETPSVEDILNRRKYMIRVLLDFDAREVPPLGYLTYRLVPNGTHERRRLATAEDREPVLENEHLRVRARTDGTLTLTEKSSGRVYSGFNRFVDDGDAGDEYTFSPPEGQKLLDSREASWRVRKVDSYTLCITGELELPYSLTADRRARSNATVRCPVSTRVRLRPWSRRVDLRTEFENAALDHRLRAVFPTGLAAAESVAETGFGVARRPTVPEQSEGWRERTGGTHGQRRFLCVEDTSSDAAVAILNKGLPEYEATQEGEVYLTLLRAVGWLSRDDLSARPVPAGPSVPTPEAQCPGRQVYEYSVMPYTGGWESAGAYRQAEEIWLPLQAKAVQRDREATSHAPLEYGSFMQLEPETVVLSALKRSEEGEGLILRVFNPAGAPVDARLSFELPLTRARRVSLNEQAVEDLEVWENTVELSVGGGRIETLRLDFARDLVG